MHKVQGIEYSCYILEIFLEYSYKGILQGI